MSWWQILLFVFATSLLGVFFAIPLRKQVVVEEKLRFPSGTACAEIMRNLHGKGEQAQKHGGVLGAFLALSALIKWLQEGIPRVLSGMSLQAGEWAGIAANRLVLGVAWDPLLLGAGFLVGPCPSEGGAVVLPDIDQTVPAAGDEILIAVTVQVPHGHCSQIVRDGAHFLCGPCPGERRPVVLPDHDFVIIITKA